MPKPITVAVTGATGAQGGALARQLLQRGHRVRALTRRPGGEPASALREAGAEIVQADLDDRAALAHALEGADAFFLMATPYAAGPEAESRQALQGVEAARDAGVEHLLYSSVGSADQATRIPHFDSKFRVEQRIAEFGLPATVLRPVFFLENFLGPMFRQGLRSGRLAMPMPADRPLQMIALHDLAAFACLTLERRAEFLGKSIDLASDEVPPREVAEVLAAVSGRRISFQEVPLQAVRAQSEDLARMWEWFDEVGYHADIAGLRRDHPEVGWRDLRAWAREQDWAFLDVTGPEQPTA